MPFRQMEFLLIVLIVTINILFALASVRMRITTVLLQTVNIFTSCHEYSFPYLGDKDFVYNFTASLVVCPLSAAALNQEHKKMELVITSKEGTGF